MKSIFSSLHLFIIASGLFFSPAFGSVAAVSADEALVRLKTGNANYVANPVSSSHATAKVRAKTTTGQQPIAVVVGCSDSRTAPEIIFNKNINRLFVVRTAGNIVDDIELGSIEYAVKVLGARLIVVMGHQNCGAVEATVKGGGAPPHIDSIIRQIKPAVALAREMQGDLLENSIHCNARHVADKIRHDAHLGDTAKEVQIVPAVYNLKTGKVDWLKPI